MIMSVQQKPPIVTLTTDFGKIDSYVGCLKGVLLGIVPNCHIVDLSHHIIPQDIRHGAWVLWSAIDSFPEGTVHLAVVDPGVGSQRKAIVVEAGGHFFVGPDNGLLWPAISRFPDYRACQIQDCGWFRDKISNTFHGRDIFAPVAAHIANGTPLPSLGCHLSEITTLELFDATISAGHITGKILCIDHFGNLITNIKAKLLPTAEYLPDCIVEIDNYRWEGIKKTFSDVDLNSQLAYIGSFGLLELAVRNTSAADFLKIERDCPIRVMHPSIF